MSAHTSLLQSYAGNNEYHIASATIERRITVVAGGEAEVLRVGKPLMATPPNEARVAEALPHFDAFMRDARQETESAFEDSQVFTFTTSERSRRSRGAVDAVLAETRFITVAVEDRPLTVTCFGPVYLAILP